MAPLLFLAISLSARADVVLPRIFSEHAVLQKSGKVPVWGRAAANEKVTVTLDKATATTTTGADGKWKVELNLASEGQGPYELIVEGANKLTIKDVVIGEVWVCSGQSNMCVSLNDTIGGKEEIAQSANPLLRQFWVARSESPIPKDDVQGSWQIASPKTTPGFSGVGYHFGKRIQNGLKIPVGLITTALGGTPSEAWTSAEALNTVPELKAGKDKIISAHQDFDDTIAKRKAWAGKHGRQERPLPTSLDAYVNPDAPTDDWKTVKLPARFSDIGLPNAGAVWLRKKVTLQPAGVKRQTWMGPGNYRDNVTIFWNGHKVGERDQTQIDQGCYIPGEFTTTPENTLALRIVSPGGEMGILPDKTRFLVENSGPLEGEWLAKVEYEWPALDGEAMASLPVQPPLPEYQKSNTATFLYNGMVHPLIPYRVAGVIWYQGEWNAKRAFQYRTAFPLMIKDWRKQWGQGDFPFYYCQLPGFHRVSTAPGDDAWAELREAQHMTLALPKTGEAILIDIGEADNIHPLNKKDAGDRLARIALAKTYAKKVACSGPTYDSMAMVGETIRIRFKNTGNGLIAKPLPATYAPTMLHPETTIPLVRNTPNSEVEGFAICGEDRKWVWANAKISGNDVIVSADKVRKPVAVRYAWSSNPVCNLYNTAGLPAGPFRTDTFPGITDKARY